jgi:hypothetical protein
MNEPTAGKPLQRNPGLRLAVSATTLVVFSTLLITVSTMESSASPAALIPSSGAYLGAHAGQLGGETKQGAVLQLESQIGRKLAIDHQYYKWDTQFPTSHESWTVGRGTIPFLNWKAQRLNGAIVPWSSIASGAEDAAIVARADAIKAFGSPIYLSFHHEPENDLATWGSPGDYAAAFRHVVEVFRSRGVTNVAFVWTMMSWTFEPRSGRDPNAYYPGDDYVEIIGVDGYNWYPVRAEASWRSFREVFQPSNDFAAAHVKPWMAVETGTQEDPDQPGRKGQWFTDIIATAKGWPLLKAVIYYNTIKDYDWRLESSVSSIQGFAQLGADPYFDPPGANLGPTPSPIPSPTSSPTPSPIPSPTSSPTPSPIPSPTSSPGLEPSPGVSGVLANSLDGGVAGQDVTSANSGGAAVSAFDSVVVQGNASLVYDDSRARGGTGLSIRHQLSARGNAYYEWNESFRTQQVWFGRVYVWFESLSLGNVRLVRARGSGALRMAIDLLPSGQLAVKDSLNRRVATMSKPILTQRWVRIEWRVDQRAGEVEVRLYNSGDISSPSGIAFGRSQRIGPNTDVVQIGRSGTQPSSTDFWTDDPAVSESGFPGPA